MSSEKIEKKQIKITQADLEGPLERSGSIHEVESMGGEVEIKLVDDSNDQNDDENKIAILGEVNEDGDDVDDEVSDPQVNCLIAELYEYLEDFNAPDNARILRILVYPSATPDEVSKAIAKQLATEADSVRSDLVKVTHALEDLTELARETYKRVYPQAAE